MREKERETERETSERGWLLMTDMYAYVLCEDEFGKMLYNQAEAIWPKESKFLLSYKACVCMYICMYMYIYKWVHVNINPIVDRLMHSLSFCIS